MCGSILWRTDSLALFRSISEEEEEDADEAGALGLPLLLPPPPLLLLLLWHSGVERGSPASQLSADEREPDRSSDDLAAALTLLTPESAEEQWSA